MSTQFKKNIVGAESLKCMFNIFYLLILRIKEQREWNWTFEISDVNSSNLLSVLIYANFAKVPKVWPKFDDKKKNKQCN